MSDTPRTDAQYGFVTALRVAKERVEASPLYERFIDGTPLSNDIAAWIAQTYCEGAEFARQLERELAEAREQRDMLAEAMRAMWPFIEEDPPCGGKSEIQQYQDALAAVKG